LVLEATPTGPRGEETMRRFTIFATLAALVLAIAAPATALPGKPDFNPHLYADGEVWGTKAAAVLPAPNGNNADSFDKLFAITNGVDGQLPVAEAAPGPGYNGGRWATQTVVWNTDPVLLTSYADVVYHEAEGHLTITPGSPGGEGAPPDYFECPLLPVK
jgi:hypothetical protein